MLCYTISMFFLFFDFLLSFGHVKFFFFCFCSVNINSYWKHTLFLRAKSTCSDWLRQDNHVSVLWSLIADIYLALENFPLHVLLTPNSYYKLKYNCINSHRHFRSFSLNFITFQNHFSAFLKFKFLKCSLFVHY